MITVPHKERAIAIWLFIVCAMIFAMVLLGGATRLTHSGLSMVEWHPLFGVLPPMSEATWQNVFKRYQEFPEYQKINFAMTLAEFKRIFLFEYSHRVLGRVPFCYRVRFRACPLAKATGGFRPPVVARRGPFRCSLSRPSSCRLPVAVRRTVGCRLIDG